MNILTRDDTEHDVECVLASEAREIEEERDELRTKVNSLEFRLSQEKHLNTDNEQDYLAVWKLIKRPDETVVQAAQRLKSENEAMRAAITELKNIVNAKPSTWGEMSDQFQPWAQNRAKVALTKLATFLP